MRVLVTGAAGFVGSHLAERLTTLGHQVTGLDCLTDYYDPALKELNAQDLAAAGVSLHRLDLAVDDLAEVVSDTEIIYHLAAQPGLSATTAFPTYARNNITATHRLLEAACSSPSLKCLVNGSTSSIYGDHATESEDAPPRPTSYYGVTKLAAEQLVMAYHRQRRLPCCSLRLFSVYGPRERPEKLYPLLIRSIFENREFPMFEGSEGHSRSFTFVGDIVDGLVSVLDHLDCVPGEIINLGSDLEMKTVRGIEIVEQILERKARIVRRPARMGDQIRTRANIDRARRLLGYDPKTTPRQGLQAEVDWFRTKFFSGVSS